MTSNSRSMRLTLALYVVVVLLYASLVGWWAYFFHEEGELLVRLFAEAGDPLSEHQQAVLHAEAERRVVMFATETAFLGLLLLASVVLVVRSLRQELALSRRQRNFLAAVTHELKSPIASARLYLESIRLGRTDAEKTERYLRHAGEDLERLGELVDDLLATRRLSTDRPDLQLQDIDLASLAARRVERHRALRDLGRAQVEVDAPEPAMTRADPAALGQVIDNLVSNAVKYGGERARVVVRVRNEARSVVLQVQDDGPGLGDVDPDAILEPFVRGRDENVRERPGAGLGLFLVSELVRAHRGALRFDPAEGGGLLVTIHLPLAPGAPRRSPPGADAASDSAAAGAAGDAAARADAARRDTGARA